MPSQKNLNSIFGDVADAIRSKDGSSDPIYPVDFADKIEAIPTGSEPTLITKTITANGVYEALSDNADGYSQVTVNVSSSDLPTLYAPTLSNGTAQRPLTINPNANQNGAFGSACVVTAGGNSKQLTMATSEFVPWIYDILPIAGGSISVSAQILGANFNASTASSRNITWATATETVGYSSVSGLGSSTINTQTYTYDADFPRSFQEVTDTYGNVFIRIPTIYRKVLSAADGQITGYALATSKLDSDYEPYPCFVDETNSNAVLPYVLIGKWCVSSTSAANSVNATYSNMSMANGRTLCRNRGIGYQQYDWKFQKLFTDLGVVLSRTININQGNYIYEIMGIRHQETYIWVDGLVRGCSEDNTAWFACDVEANYQNAGGGTSTATTVSEATILNNGYYKLSYTAPSGNGWITKLGYDTDHPFFNYPNAATGGSSTAYYCDQYYQSSGSRPVDCYVGYSGNFCGWFYCNTGDYWSNSYAVRLCFRPVTGATGYTE